MKTYIDDSTQTPSEIFISECSNGFNDIPYAIGAVTLSNDGNTKTRKYVSCSRYEMLALKSCEYLSAPTQSFLINGI
jgi:hypothetical protein